MHTTGAVIVTPELTKFISAGEKRKSRVFGSKISFNENHLKSSFMTTPKGKDDNLILRHTNEVQS